jgi:tetratricopeptide (TPR) repeat protein
MTAWIGFMIARIVQRARALRHSRFCGRFVFFGGAMAFAGLLLFDRPLAAQQQPADGDSPAASGTLVNGQSDGKPQEAPEQFPKLDEMETPTIGQLLTQPPIDWIVLKNDDVIVTAPVYPRPDTLAKMQEAIDHFDEQPRPRSREAAVAHREERDALQKISILDPDAGSASPESLLNMRHVDRIIYFEDMLLQRIKELIDAGKLRDAFEALFTLERRSPDWPGLVDYQIFVMFAEARARLEKQEVEQALYFLEEIHDRNPAEPELPTELGHVVDLLISEAVERGDFRRARHFLRRLRQRFSGHQTAARWTDSLASRSAALVRDGLNFSRAGHHDQAAIALEQAANVWPVLPRLRQTHGRISGRYQRLRVGVLRTAGERSAYFLPTEADRREKYLTRTSLFEVIFSDDAAHYHSGFFENWEPTELGRRAAFTLRQERLPWESRPVVTSAIIVDTLAARLRPDDPGYDERFDSYVKGISVQSPFQFEIQFERVPLQMEALFHHPLLQTGSNDAANDETAPEERRVVSERFRRFDQSTNRTVYRRSRPEPEGLSRYHVAEVVELRYDSHDLALQGLLRGEVSVLPHVQNWDVPRLSEDDRFFVQQYALPVTHVLQLNPHSATLENGELRRALAYAIDRESVLRNVVLRDPNATRGRVVTAPFSTQSSAYSALLPRPYDPSLAFALGATAKKRLKGEIPVLRLVCAPDPIVRAAADELVKQWALAKIPVVLVADDNAGEQTARQQWDLLYRTVRMADPVVELWPFVTIGAGTRVEALDRQPPWIRQALVELDNAVNWQTAISVLRRLQRSLVEDVKLIPLWEVDDFLVIRKNIRGFPERPTQTYQNIERCIVRPWYPGDEQ